MIPLVDTDAAVTELRAVLRGAWEGKGAAEVARVAGECGLDPSRVEEIALGARPSALEHMLLAAFLHGGGS